jgi:hypothetical protein
MQKRSKSASDITKDVDSTKNKKAMILKLRPIDLKLNFLP